MTSDDFVRGFLGLFPDQNFNEVKEKFSIHSDCFVIDEKRRKSNDLVDIA